MEKTVELVTYLAFNGQCEEAFKHYETVFGGKILMMMRGKDMPAETPLPPDSANRIMHARLKIGGRLLMGGDNPHYSKAQGFSVQFMADNRDEAERIFRDLSEGGTITMPMAQTFWADRFGMLIDKFGVPWMVNYEKAEDRKESGATSSISSSAKGM